jgi:hypothetical protein
MRAPLGLTDGGSYVDGIAVGTAQLNFSREKNSSCLFLLVRAQNSSFSGTYDITKADGTH